MQIHTHLLSGWCVADLFSLTPRERFLAMAAASAADLDGLGIIFGIQYYADFHHLIGHNIFYGALLAGILCVFSMHRLKALLLYFALFHLHLLMDYYGSGPGWGIYYWWPVSRRAYENPAVWDFASWQNMCAALFFLAWCIGIAVRRGRSPLEFIAPTLERRLMGGFRQRA